MNAGIIEMDNNRKYRFIFAYPENERVFDGFKAESAKQRIEVVPVYRNMYTRIGRIAKKIILSVIINKYIRMPFRGYFHSINKYRFADDIDYYVIVPTMSLIRWDTVDLEKFKAKHKNIRLILLILDSMHAGSRHLPYVKKTIFSDVWDLKLSYDKYDSQEFGFTWLGYTYYPQCDVLPPIEETSDALYVGFNKGGRNKTIAELYLKLKNNGVKCNFKVVKENKEEEELAPGLCLTSKRFEYCEIAAMAKNTNCVVEVLMEGQLTQSYRYFEAITYNKKLLTNNPNISSLPFYDARYMKSFSTISDVDVDWVKKKEQIDYGYHGEFSQINLLNYLEDFLGLDVMK